MIGSTACIIEKNPNTLSRSCCSRIDRVVVSTVPRKCVPALLTRMSMRPNASRAALTNRFTAASSVTSVGTPIVRGPILLSSFTAEPRRSALRLQTATPQPALRRECAMAFPIPRDAPVTTATFPRNPRSIRSPHLFLYFEPRSILYGRIFWVKLTRRQREMDLGIKGRRAIVTGGGSGIGYETARLFLEEGARVLIAGRTTEKINKARDELAKKTGGEVHAVQADMTKEADIKCMVETAKEKLGGVDILVNNAGTMYSGRFAVLNDDELKIQLETKLFGFMRAIRLVYPLMKAQKWGRIVNTIGGAGKEPDPYMFGSGMTNSALLNLTKSLSAEFGEDNVLVNAICPGWVDTNLWKRNAEGLKQELGVKSEEEARKLAARKNSLNRMGKPEELANATVFLCSERASYITGVSLNMDGGRLKGLW